MVSKVVKEKFAALLAEYANCEKKVEVVRQVLIENKAFDAYAAFRRVTTEYLGGITIPELGKFLKDCGVDFYPEDLDLLFVHLDFDSDGLVSWPEFLDAILAREYHSNYVYGTPHPCNAEIEVAMSRVLETEMQNERSLESRRVKIWEISELREGALFDEIDTEHKGFLTLANFQTFVNQFNTDVPFADIERAFRRIDEDNDDRILFDEFVRVLRPMYCYKYFDHYIPQGKDISPSKVFQPTHSPAPLRHQEKQTTATRISEIEQANQRERTKNLADKRGASLDLTVTTNLQANGSSLNESVVRTRGALDPFKDYAWRGYYPDYNRSWQGPPAELTWGFGPHGLGMGGPYQNHKQPLLNKDWSYWQENPYINAASRRVERGQLNEELFQKRMTLSPDRADTLKQRALELSPSRKRRPYYYERHGSINESQTQDNLRDSTMAGINSLKNDAPTQHTGNTDLLKSELMCEQPQETPKDPGSALLRSQYQGKYNEDPITEVGLNVTSGNHKTNWVELVRDNLKDVLNIEGKRKNLAMRFDFCLLEIFNQIDLESTGYIGLNDMDEWSKAGKINMTREDWAMMLDRYDTSLDSKFSFSEFNTLFLPWTEVYKKEMVNRSKTDVKNFHQYTVQTRKMLKDLFYCLVMAEKNFENNRFKTSNGVFDVSTEVFEWINTGKTGFITCEEFTTCLKSNKVKVSEHSARQLFEQWDKDMDGKIAFKEFHTVNKNAICVDYIHA